MERKRGRMKQLARQISQRICNTLSAAWDIKYYTIFMAAHTGGLNNRQKHRWGAGKAVHGVEAEVRGIRCRASCGCKCSLRNHKQLLAANCCMFLELCVCMFSELCLCMCMGVCCLLIKSRKTIKKITAYNLQTVMFSPPPPSLSLHFLCLPACNTFTLGWSPLKSSVSFYFGKQRKKEREKGNKNCIRHLNGKTNRKTLCNPFQLPSLTFAVRQLSSAHHCLELGVCLSVESVCLSVSRRVCTLILCFIWSNQSFAKQPKETTTQSKGTTWVALSCLSICLSHFFDTFFFVALISLYFFLSSSSLLAKFSQEFLCVTWDK